MRKGWGGGGGGGVGGWGKGDFSKCLARYIKATMYMGVRNNVDFQKIFKSTESQFPLMSNYV